MRVMFCLRAILSVLLFSVVTPGFSQSAAPTREELFATTQAGIAQAKATRAELLAPRGLTQAMEMQASLDKDFNKQAKPDKLRKGQAELLQQIAKTQQLVEQSNKTLATVIKAYDDAVLAGAPKAMGEAWLKGEQRFKQAVAKVESNDLDAARAKGAEAEVLLRDLELQSIKQSVLGAARDLIAKVQVAHVPELAPRSFVLAQQQLAMADQELNRSRYELAEPQRLAAQASYEALHAQYLAGWTERAQSKDGVKQQLAEAQLLAIEDPLKQLLTELEIAPVFDQGYIVPLQQASAKAQQQQQLLLSAQQDVRDRDQQITDMDTTIKKLEARLGGESVERQALVKQLSVQERLRDNISKIETMFSVQEGRVYRQANQLIISLNAISFRSGKSTIEPASFPLLAKLGDALKLFPTASMSVEGHTDGTGTDSANLLLSQDRADAVRQYLISNLGINAEQVSSIGYGEAKPIASNDTDNGRARNRRIDVVMQLDRN